MTADVEGLRTAGGRVTLDPEMVSDPAMVAAFVADAGWPVIAIEQGTKAPLKSGGKNHQAAWLRTPREVLDAAEGMEAPQGWTQARSFAVMTGIQLRQGPALVALDLDGDMDELAALLEEAGPEAQAWARSAARVQRCDQRMHLYGVIEADGVPTTGLLAPGLEWRGLGGYILLPKSKHPQGQRYEFTGGAVLDSDECVAGSFYGGWCFDESTQRQGPRWRPILPVPASLVEVVVRRRGPARPIPLPSPRPVRDGHPRALDDTQTAARTGEVSTLADGRADAYSARALAGIVAELEASSPWPVGHRDDRGRGWEKLQADAAFRLARLALAEWSRVTMAEAEEAFLAHAPVGGGWTARHRATKWNDQRRRAEQKGPLELPADEFAGLEFEFVTDDPRPTIEDDTMTDVRVPDEAEFWGARPLLTAVRDFARARRVGPWALLGAVLARAAAAVPPVVVLPPTRGSVASLNLFVGLCGESGSGKSAAMDAAREFLDIAGGSDFLETSPGSGEGLLGAYVFAKTAKGEPTKIVQTRVAVLLDVDEVGSLGALTSRTNSTLLPFLKTAWSGRTLATENAEAFRKRKVEAHRYRLAAVCGIQPANAGAILDDADGGFPQRFLWMPTYDPGMLPYDAESPSAQPMHWTVPAAQIVVDETAGTITWTGRQVMELPEAAVTAILEAAEAQDRPIGAPAPAAAMDGHALLTRAKVAALLALLDGRGTAVNEEDWALSGTVMAVSDATRAAIVKARSAEVARANVARGRAEGHRAAVAAETEDAIRVRRLGLWVMKKLAGHPEGLSASDLRRVAASRDRKYLDEALHALVAGGLVVVSEIEYKGQRGQRYRVAGGTS